MFILGRPFIYFSIGICLLAFSSCNREGCTDPSATNFDDRAETENGSCHYAVVAPPTYEFTDNEGNNTVNYTGQHQRLNMLSEIMTYLHSANTAGTALEIETLLDMYSNDGYVWDDSEELGMTGSTKNLASKTAGGDPTIVAQFEQYFLKIGEASATTSVGETNGNPGVSGLVQSTSNPTMQFLQSGEGQEWAQLIEKGLMGSCFYYNLSRVYLGAEKMNVDNAVAVDPANGKFYTVMEHHWDEAYGYFTEATDYPLHGTHRFWGKEAFERENLLQSATSIAHAFRLGRAAISQGVMSIRDEQIDLIQQEMEWLVAGSAIHCLNEAVNHFDDDALRNHSLSEAKALILSLPYGADSSVDMESASDLVAQLGEDFYAVTLADIGDLRDDLAAIAGLFDLRLEL